MQGVEEETFQLDRGLDLVVSHSRTGLKRVANLVLAANRMKELSELCGDAQLCDAIMDDVVQGGQRGVAPNWTATSTGSSSRLSQFYFYFFSSYLQKLLSMVAATPPPPQRRRRNPFIFGYIAGSAAICWTTRKKWW